MIQKRDLLKEIYSKKITEQEARALWDAAVQEHPGGDTAYEYMAITTRAEQICLEPLMYVFSQISFTVLAQWRYEGWPPCAVCGKPCDLNNDEGYPLEKLHTPDALKENVIVHFDCAPTDETFKALGIWQVIEKAVHGLIKINVLVPTIPQECIGDSDPRDFIVCHIVRSLVEDKTTRDSVLGGYERVQDNEMALKCVVNQAVGWLEEHADIRIIDTSCDVAGSIVKALYFQYDIPI